MACIRIFPVLPALVLAGAFSSPVMAAYHTWPGAAPCDTTLQACIELVADGDTVAVASNGVIDEDLFIEDRNLSLRAERGFHPRLASGRWIWLSGGPGAGDQTVALSGIHLEAGKVAAFYNGTGQANYTIENIRAQSIDVRASSGTVQARLYNNHLVMTLPVTTVQGIIVDNEGASFDVDVLFNRIDGLAGAAVKTSSGIRVDFSDGSGGRVNLLGNQIRGNFAGGGIVISEGRNTGGSTAASSLHSGVYSNLVACNSPRAATTVAVKLMAQYGKTDVEVLNNTLVNCEVGLSASFWLPPGPQADLNGLFSNNLIAHAAIGLLMYPDYPVSLDNDYNLINADTPVQWGFALGAHDITAPAQLVSSVAPRLRASSPAIDAADSSALAAALATQGLPPLDADGLRRFKGGGAEVADIGAFEYGDFSLGHQVAAASASHESSLNDPLLNGDSSLDLFVTPSLDGGLAGPDVPNGHPFGTRFLSAGSGGSWTLFEQDPSRSMPANAHFNMFRPAPGTGVLRHAVTAASLDWRIAGSLLTLGNPDLDHDGGTIVLLTQNWDAGTGLYNDQHVGLTYFDPVASGGWYVTSLDHADGSHHLPAGAGFSVYAQHPSPNAFKVGAVDTDSEIVLDHPLLNDTPCAMPVATRQRIWTAATPVSGGYDLRYDSGRWRIHALGGSLAGGTAFNVLVNPRQVALCRDTIFRGGFDG